MTRTLSLIVRNLLFTIVVPGLGGAWVPWWILTRHGGTATPAAWEAVAVIAGLSTRAWEYAGVLPDEAPEPGQPEAASLSRPRAGLRHGARLPG